MKTIIFLDSNFSRIKAITDICESVWRSPVDYHTTGDNVEFIKNIGAKQTDLAIINYRDTKQNIAMIIEKLLIANPQIKILIISENLSEFSVADASRNGATHFFNWTDKTYAGNVYDILRTIL